MARRRAVEHVTFQHGVPGNAGQRDAMVLQHMQVVFAVLHYLGPRRGFQQWLECAEHIVTRELVRGARARVCHRHIGGLTGCHRE